MQNRMASWKQVHFLLELCNKQTTICWIYRLELLGYVVETISVLEKASCWEVIIPIQTRFDSQNENKHVTFCESSAGYDWQRNEGSVDNVNYKQLVDLLSYFNPIVVISAIQWTNWGIGRGFISWCLCLDWLSNNNCRHHYRHGFLVMFGCSLWYQWHDGANVVLCAGDVWLTCFASDNPLCQLDLCGIPSISVLASTSHFLHSLASTIYKLCKHANMKCWWLVQGIVWQRFCEHVFQLLGWGHSMKRNLLFSNSLLKWWSELHRGLAVLPCWWASLIGLLVHPSVLLRVADCNERLTKNQ